MKSLIIALTLMALASTSYGEDFYPVEFGLPTIFSSTTSDTEALGDLWPVSNLLQGPDEGFDAAEPHTGQPAGPDFAWVTRDNAGFPADYIEQVTTPVIVFDFQQDVQLDEISVWGYSATNSNGVSAFSLRFAIEGEDPEDFDNGSIEFNPTYFPQNAFDGDRPLRQSLEFGEVITARYVEMTMVDNFFLPPGDGSGGAVDEFYEGYIELPGGDRVGLGEVAFRLPRIPPTADCDFDGNSVCDIADLDELLYLGLVNGDLKYDLDSSGVVDLVDRDVWLDSAGNKEIATPYVLGDADLNGLVNSQDLNAVGVNWLRQDATSWAQGDFEGDGDVDVGNLNDLGVNWQHGVADGASVVPEPNTALISLVGMIGLLLLRRRRR